METVISVSNLTKQFRNVLAIYNLSFEIKRGEILGLVGPDGSGKSTLIKLLAGILKPTSGKILIFNKDIQIEYEELKPFIGYLSQNFSHYLDLTVEENLEFFAEIHKIRNFRERLEYLLEFAKLKNFRRTLISNLSGGMKQKLALISSLIYDPEILLLDEPTTGVDPISRREFWFLLNQLISKGKTIVFATPYLDEAERFNKVLFLSNGKMLILDTPDAIVYNFEYSVAEVICSDLNFARKVLSNLAEVQMFGDRLNIVFPKGNVEFLERIRDILLSNGVKIQQITTIKPRLENVFFYKVKGNIS